METIIGLVAGALTSFGFVPQIVKGLKTKKMEDVSYYMPVILAVGMSLWLVYGLLRRDIAIIAANIFGTACNIVIVAMKRMYERNRDIKNYI
ncbi:MAG: SemiSWEET transporter [Thermoplasmata archaeon]|nr:SemiSWEET transporter [Thermoplasmata archaeon]